MVDVLQTPEEYVTPVILPFLNPSLYRLLIDFSIYKNKCSCKKHQLNINKTPNSVLSL
jgi:hypothetical protein